MNYILINDDDGNWYVIPEDKQDTWNDWMNSEDYDDGMEIPKYASKVDGCPSTVKFKNWEIK